MTTKRAAAVWALLALATLLSLICTFTVWAKRQILDTNEFTHASAQVLANDEVRSTLAQGLVDRLYGRVDVAQRLGEALPPGAQGAAPVIAAAIRANAVRVAEAFLATPAAQTAWERANRRAHEALVKVIEGKSVGRLSTKEGAATLDTNALLRQLTTRLGIKDPLAGRPTEGGDIVLLRSDQLELVQDAVRLVKALSLFLALLVLGLYALAIYLARSRRRVILEVAGASFVLVGLIVLVARRIAGPELVDTLVKTEASRPAAKAVFAIETEILRELGIALIVYGLFGILAGFLAGPSRVAVGTRRALAPFFQRRPLVVHATALVLFLIVIAWGPIDATRRLLGIVILGGLFLLAIEVWRRQIVREFPPDYPGAVGWSWLWRGRAARASRAYPAEARVEVLERLQRLRASGALTDAEYGAEKARVLGDGAAQVAPAAPSAGR